MAINSVANPGVLDMMHRHGLQQVGRLSVANANIHTANGYPATQGAQRVRFPKLTSPDLIPTKRNEIMRNTRKTGRSVGNPLMTPVLQLN